MSYPPASLTVGSGTINGFNYAAYCIFNNSSAGYQPPAGKTTSTFQALVNGVALTQAGYALLWHAGAPNGWATNVSGSSTDKSSTCDPAKKYTYTVYYQTAPPSQAACALNITYS